MCPCLHGRGVQLSQNEKKIILSVSRSNEGDKSLYLKEDVSRGYVHNHCIEWFTSPCTEGTICKDISHSHNQDLMRGSLLIIEVLLVFHGVLVITLVRSIGMTFCLRIGTGLAVRLGRVTRLAV